MKIFNLYIYILTLLFTVNLVSAQAPLTEDLPYFSSTAPGILLLNTDKYRFYAESHVCIDSFVLILKVDGSYRIQGDNEYLTRLEKELFPSMEKIITESRRKGVISCGILNNVTIKNQVAGSYISRNGVFKLAEPTNIYTYAVSSVLVYTNPRKGNFITDDMKWNGWSSLNFADKDLKEQEQKRLAFEKRENDPEVIKKREKERAEILKRQEEEVKQREEQLKLGEEEKQRRIATPLLKVLEQANIKTPVTQIDLQGYQDQKIISDILLGKFDDYYERKSSGEIIEPNLALYILNTSYHIAFQKQCFDKVKVEWKSVTGYLRYEIIENRWGNDKMEEENYEFQIQEPFAQEFGWSLNKVLAVIRQDERTRMKSYFPDYTRSKVRTANIDSVENLKKLISSLNCTSPILRQLEVNLDLAMQEVSPLQSLYKPSLDFKPVNKETTNQKNENLTVKPKVNSTKSTNSKAKPKSGSKKP